MRLQATDTIAGFPILAVRDALRTCSWTSEPLLGARLGIPKTDALALLQVLLDHKLITPHPHDDGVYAFTIAGNAFRLAHALKPIPRAKADQLVQDLLARVRLVNDSPDFLIRVDSVHAFGSYITASPTVNDVDLIIDRSDKDLTRDRAERALAHARRSGRHFSTFLDQLFWPDHQVVLFLKNRSPRLSLHSIADGIIDQVRLVQLFPITAVRRPRRRT